MSKKKTKSDVKKQIEFNNALREIKERRSCLKNNFVCTAVTVRAWVLMVSRGYFSEHDPRLKIPSRNKTHSNVEYHYHAFAYVDNYFCSTSSNYSKINDCASWCGIVEWVDETTIGFERKNIRNASTGRSACEVSVHDYHLRPDYW